VPFPPPALLVHCAHVYTPPLLVHPPIHAVLVPADAPERPKRKFIAARARPTAAAGRECGSANCTTAAAPLVAPHCECRVFRAPATTAAAAVRALHGQVCVRGENARGRRVALSGARGPDTPERPVVECHRWRLLDAAAGACDAAVAGA
jgi:hypothetical protein